MQESDPTAESSASEENPPRWKITTTQAMIVGPVLGGLVTAWALTALSPPPCPAPTPDLVYTVDEEIKGEMRVVTIKIQNQGDAPSENMYGWIEFPSGDRPWAASGPRDHDFEVQVGAVWKRLRKQTGLRSSEARVYIRTQLLQPGIWYTLQFAAESNTSVDADTEAKVHLIDDTGRARPGQW